MLSKQIKLRDVKYKLCAVIDKLRIHCYATALDKARIHYENTPIQIYRKFHLQKLKFFR